MGAFIYSNLKYPTEALEKKTQGVVLVKYDIDYKGNVVATKVAKSVGDGCDEEAIRIVKLFKFEVPKGPRKLRVLFHKSVKIKFALPKAKPKTITKPANQYQYQFVPTKQEAKKEAVKKPTSYTITINVNKS